MPGIYAWAMTTAPIAWASSAPVPTRVAAAAAPLLLFAGSRVSSLWAFVSSCGYAWATAPQLLTGEHMDSIRGVAGMVGWALFALGIAAAPAGFVAAPSSDDASGATQGQRVAAWTDRVSFATAGLGAALCQLGGWGSDGSRIPERLLFVRFAGIAAGLALLAFAAECSIVRNRSDLAAPAGSVARIGRGARVVLPILLVAASLAEMLLGSGG